MQLPYSPQKYIPAQLFNSTCICIQAKVNKKLIYSLLRFLNKPLGKLFLILVQKFSFCRISVAIILTSVFQLSSAMRRKTIRATKLDSRRQIV